MTILDLNELQKLTCQGDRRAEGELFGQLTARFRLFARQRLWIDADAEEVVQEALATIVERHRQIEFESSFVGWAYQVLNNKLMTFAATKGRREKKMEELVELSSVPRDEPGSELETRLLNCLNALNRANSCHARILNLHYQGFTVKEICVRLGLTRTNFYTILSRARSMLAACLDEGGVK